MWRYNYVNSTELYHYGIPGMKWGQRIASKWNEHFDKRRVKLEEKYRKQGMSKKDAQIKAEKSVKGEKITTGVASAVGTAALGYAAYRLLRGPKSKSNSKTNIKVTDKPINKNTLIEKINSKAGNNPSGSDNGIFTTKGKPAKFTKGKPKKAMEPFKRDGKTPTTYNPFKNGKMNPSEIAKDGPTYIGGVDYAKSILGSGWNTSNGPSSLKGSQGVNNGMSYVFANITTSAGEVFEGIVNKKK